MTKYLETLSHVENQISLAQKNLDTLKNSKTASKDDIENATAQFVGADCTTKQAAVVDYVALPDKLTKHDGAHAFRQGDVCFLVLLKY